MAVVDLQGDAAVRYLTDARMAAISPAWSPTGGAIAYVAAPQSLDASGGEQARRLVARRRIWRVDPEGRTPPRQLTHDAGYRDETPIWSGDGRHLLFGRIANGNVHTLWLMAGDGTHAVQVTKPLSLAPQIEGAIDDWSFGFYGHVDWRDAFDWFRG